MGSITLGNKDASIVLTSDQDRYVRELAERATGTAIRTMERTVSEIGIRARTGWPVGTNPRQRRSRDQIVDGIRLVSDSQGPYIGAYVGNDAPWAYYIKSKQVSAYGSEASVTLSPPLPLDRQEAEAESDSGRALHAFSELIRKPFKSEEGDLASELQDQTVKLARSL